MVYVDKSEPHGSFFYYRGLGDCGDGFPELHPGEGVVTQSGDVYGMCMESSIPVEYLSHRLGLPDSLGLYEIFSYYFDGKLTSDYDMLDALFHGFLQDSGWCFCLKVGVSFCWFQVGAHSLRKLGVLQFSDMVSKSTVGRFFKRLRYAMARSGVNLSRVKYLVWDSLDVGYEFSRYILRYDSLSDFFSRVTGLSGLDCVNVMRLLSSHVGGRYKAEAGVFVDCLNEGFSALGLSQSDGVLYCREEFFKDYSSCSGESRRDSRFGLILDCEGVSGQDGSLSNGLSELGGIIWCRHGNVLLNLDTFSCDSALLDDVLLAVVDNYRQMSGVSKGKVDAVVFGGSDSRMLSASCSKKVMGKLNLVDCKEFVYGYVPDIEGRNTLSNIARAMGVCPVFPKHNPVNDARTLFNVLAHILQVSGDFVV